ncbi:MAG TPA: hypothetical protein VGH01_11720 [Jatrophihabitantaceae bacterium]
MVSDPQLELRVSRLENDTHSIYDLIADIRSTQQEHSQRLAKLETTVAVGFDGVAVGFDGVDARFDGVAGGFDGVDARFDGVAGRFDGVDARFDGVDARFDQLESTTNARFDSIETTLAEVVRRLPEPS